MATESPNDLELALKKRARRRLVGAIALVLLMVIVLPMVLQDRAALAPQEAIKITMPDDVGQQLPKAEANLTSIEPQAEVASASESVKPESVKSESPAVTEIDKQVPSESAKEVSDIKKELADEKKAEDKKLLKKAEVITTDTKKSEVKSTEPKTPEIKKTDVKEPSLKEPEVKAASTNGETFTIQVGVFSDAANVKQLQARLKQVGLDSHTENITTPKGEKIRLRAGRFNSRQEAAYALIKLQSADLTGMVISNN
ncbi:SPOR domain-containing protein [Methylotenera sp.]|uniref:SPOR domain-containing protein n=1 Tax=Methylotenera sp. TaxID=2051956 RepID=UPI0024873B4F|nr:SPOR domain-containing protein [Methylotenera sp.]MDI1299977.1 SPOR domain-containing protein [Methylotenera sp.]